MTPCNSNIAYRDRTIEIDGGSGTRRAGKILVAAHDDRQRAVMTDFLLTRGYAFVAAETAQDVLLHLRPGGFDLLVSAMDDVDGIEMLRQARQMFPGLPVILIAPGAAGLDDRHLDCAVGLTREASGDAGVRLACLTQRERQVLNLIVAGRANKMIAYELSISPRTVENHRARLMEKLRAKSVAELVRLALGAADFAPRGPVALTSANDTGHRAVIARS